MTFSIADLNTLYTDGGFDAWLTSLATDNLDKFMCMARVPRNLNLWGVEAGDFNINANGLSYFENFDFSQFFKFDFTLGFTDFDIDNLATLDATKLTAFNVALQPFFSAFEIFNSMGIFDFNFAELDATSILSFDINSISR